MDDGHLQIRSFRVVFRTERRIHRIDRYRLPVPYGLPLRSTGYAVAALVVVLLLQRMPIVGSVLLGMPAPARLALLPIAASYALTQIRIDGRTAHSTATSWLRHLLGPRRYVAFRPSKPERRVALGDVTLVPDGTDGRWHCGTVVGPADVFVGLPTDARRQRRNVTLRTGRTPNLAVGSLSLDAGQRLVLR